MECVKIDAMETTMVSVNGKESETYFHSAVQIQNQWAGGRFGNAKFIF